MTAQQDVEHMQHELLAMLIAFENEHPDLEIRGLSSVDSDGKVRSVRISVGLRTAWTDRKKEEANG
jgi:hypothetical protein